MAQDCVADNENLVDCVYCGIKISQQLLDTVHHNIDDDNLCELYKGTCPYKCDIENPIIIKDHLRVCSNQPLWCPYSVLGCLSDTVARGEMERHLCQQGSKHTEILLQSINNLVNSIQKLESIIETMKEDDQKRITTLEEEVERLKTININLQRQIEENISVEIVNEETEKNTCLIDVLSRRLDSLDLKYEKKHFEFVWKVPNFQSLVIQATEDSTKSNINSSKFVSFRNGYKFQMILYPNGVGQFKNQYISLCYRLIENKFDDLLSWPFKYNVELRLLNQVDPNKDVVNNIFYDPSDVDMAESYKRPLSKDVRVYSCLRFVKKAVLAEDENLRKNDALFIRFCAKPFNIID